MGFGKTNENEVYTYHENRLKKLLLRDFLGITIDGHLKLNEHITNVCKSTSKKLNALSRVSFLLTYQQRKVVSNSFIIWMCSSIRSYRKINKLNERSLRLCQNYYVNTWNYGELLSKQGLVNIH